MFGSSARHNAASMARERTAGVFLLAGKRIEYGPHHVVNFIILATGDTQS